MWILTIIQYYFEKKRLKKNSPYTFILTTCRTEFYYTTRHCEYLSSSSNNLSIVLKEERPIHF